MKKCKYGNYGVWWRNEKARDIINNEPGGRSSEGHWSHSSDVTCERFETTDEQLDKRQGILICRDCSKCCLYEECEKNEWSWSITLPHMVKECKK